VLVVVGVFLQQQQVVELLGEHLELLEGLKRGEINFLKIYFSILIQK